MNQGISVILVGLQALSTATSCSSRQNLKPKPQLRI